MTDLYSVLGGGPAPETRREEGRPPPPPPSWTGPVQLPWSRRQPLPGLSLILESPTRSSRTIPGPLPLSTTQPHFRLSRPLIAIAPGLGARGKRKKKKKAAGGRSLLSPPSSPVAIRSAAAAPAPAVSVRFDWAGPLPLFPQLHRPTSCSATLPPVATRPQLPPGPGRALGPGFGSGGGDPLSVLPRPDSRVAERRPRVRGPALLRVWLG